MPGVTIRKFGPVAARMRAASWPDAMQPVEACFVGQASAGEHEVGGREGRALLAEVVGRQVGEHGDGEELHLALAAA